MPEILTIVGARPQIIKAAAISRALLPYGGQLNETILHTGQHYDANMSAVFFEELGIPQAKINLGVGSDTHARMTAAMISGIEKAIIEIKPDIVLVYGDTNSTLAGALAASKLRIPVAHVEAGLRSFNRTMPEEINRILADRCSTLLFCPTQTAIDNLIREGFPVKPAGPISPDHPALYLSGDVMYDNTLYFAELAEQKSDVLKRLGLESGGYHLATIHRESNTDDRDKLLEILKGLGEVSHISGQRMIVPLHPRTNNSLYNLAFQHLTWTYPELVLIPPVSFFDMSTLEKNCSMVFTDSGGVQKEAFFHKKPVVVLRSETEWVEIIHCGAGILAGPSSAGILEAFHAFSTSTDLLFPSIFGNGDAADNIIQSILEYFDENKA
jgi:UDP-GlcNAc3NAcA epimerase